jgi:hypothetical protein
MDWHQNFILQTFKDIHLFKPVFQQTLSLAGALATTKPKFIAGTISICSANVIK